MPVGPRQEAGDKQAIEPQTEHTVLRAPLPNFCVWQMFMYAEKRRKKERAKNLRSEARRDTAGTQKESGKVDEVHQENCNEQLRCFYTEACRPIVEALGSVVSERKYNKQLPEKNQKQINKPYLQVHVKSKLKQTREKTLGLRSLQELFLGC